ncbi:MAG: hypothetical protein QXL74_08615 [Candidatus Bathyarchaeia archaeon]
MEQAVYITRIEDLTRININSYSRLYFGHEFCERLLPSLEKLEEALKFALKNNFHFTFLTPYVTNEGIKKVNILLDFLAREAPQSEVVFNDYGVFRLLRNNYSVLKPVMGRLLNRMKRDPRIINIYQLLPESARRYFKGFSLDVPAFRDFLLKNDVTRVELDNVFQGIDLNISFLGFSASLYIPYAYITTTRACLAINCDVHGMEDIVGIFPCKKECQKYTFYLRSRAMPVMLIRKGNTIFMKNEKVADDIEEKGVDRIVHEIDIPI